MTAAYYTMRARGGYAGFINTGGQIGGLTAPLVVGAIVKTSADVVAANIFDGIEAGSEDIFPDVFAQAIGAQWLHDPKAVQTQFVPAQSK